MAMTVDKRDPGLRSKRLSINFSGTYTAASVTDTTKTGVVVGAGVITITPGFIPERVMVKNVTDRLTQEWFKGMNTGDFIETVAAGDQTLETDDKLTVSPTTGVIVITVDGGAMTDNDTVIVVAEEG